MGLDKLVYIPSVGTDALYSPEEKAIHERLLKLYHARMKQDVNYFDKPDKKTKKRRKAKPWEKQPWKKACYNRLIKKEKDKLTALLDENVKSTKPRVLDSSLICTKTTVSLFESALTRALGIKTWNFSKDLIILNVFFFQVFESAVKYGFMLDGEKYIFLTASAGQIRTKRALFIRETAYQPIEKRMMCGLTVEHINELGGMNPNKYAAYLALNNSATEIWEDFNIDKSIVVDDWETDVGGEVDYIDDVTYEIKHQYTNTTIPHMDGCGIMLDGPTRMCRMPWVKGLLVQFPYDEFIKEKCDGHGIVVDIYGQEHDVIAEDIRYIFTKSQFKLWKFYSSWEEYKTYFKQYGCEACYCNIEEKYIRRSKINYQMLQTLSDMTDGEIARLVKETNHEIEEIGHDFQTTMKLLGAVPENSGLSYFQQALMIYPELFRDYYCRDILKQTKLSLVKQAKGGRLRVNGKYLFLSPDLYAFCEWLFLGDMNPRGLLENGEVYCNAYADNDELACLRSPHLYREWAVRKNKRNEETDRWLGGTKCVYTSCHDLISRYLMFD